METCNEIVVSIRDFQIIKKASLTFKPGLTAIIGQSNNGKSAIFRAIKSCVYNEPGATSIRNGCSSYLVGIQMNGHTVICQKGKNSMYKVDGVTYQKVGRTQLPEVARSLNIRELNLNGSNEQINFWDQMEKPFLLDRSETELFRFIVDSGKDNNIMQASKSLVSDRQSITKEITMIEGMIAQSEANVKSYEEKLANSDETLAICERIIKQSNKFYSIIVAKLNIDKVMYEEKNIYIGFVSQEKKDSIYYSYLRNKCMIAERILAKNMNNMLQCNIKYDIYARLKYMADELKGE